MTQSRHVMFAASTEDEENIEYIKKALRTSNKSHAIRHALRVVRLLEESRLERGGDLFMREDPDRELVRMRFL